MFSLAAGLYETYIAPPQINILLVGQEKVGKTTLLERVKVTEFSKNPTVSKQQQQQQQETTTTIKRGRSFLCPAPSRYANAKDDDDTNTNNDPNGTTTTTEEQQKELQKSLLSAVENPILIARSSSSQQSQLQSNYYDRNNDVPETNRQSSMEDIPIDDNGDDNCDSSIVEDDDTNGSDDDDSDNHANYDLKPGAHMLHKDKIRPTYGMNLAKLEMCTAKCHFWDLGGKMKDIRKRYYADADALVYVVPFNIQQQQQQQNGRKYTTMNDKEIQQQQLILLEEIQTQLSDLVPVLVFVNIKGIRSSSGHNTSEYQSLLSSSIGSGIVSELKKTHSNVTVMVGSARTGQGVRSAFEWLIPIAKQQQVKRQQVQLDKYHD